MAIYEFKATSQLLEGMKVQSESRGLKLILDEPPEFGGTDTAMNPLEALLSAVASCQILVAKEVAEKLRIELEDIKVEIEGNVDSAGWEGDPNVKVGFQSIKSKFIIKTNASESKVKKMIDMAEKLCPAGATVSQGADLHADFVIEK